MTQSRGTLYRYPDEGKLGGVCAGLGHYFGIDVWLVRVLVVAGTVLSAGSFFVVAYIALWFILDRAPLPLNKTVEGKIRVKNKVWQDGESPRQAVRDINEQFSRLEQRLRSMESYVTSNEYQLNRQINRL